MAGSLADEVDLLREFISRWWAGRAVHESQDGVDLDAVIARLRARAIECAGVWDYAIAVRESLWALGDGHLSLGRSFLGVERAFQSNVCFGSAAEGIALLWVDRDSPAARQVSAGALLVEADGVPANAYLDSLRLRPGSTPGHRRWNAISSLSFRELLPGEELSPGTVSVKNGRGETHTVSLQWKPVDVEQPTPHCVRGKLLEESLGYLDIPSFYCRDELGQVSDLEFRRQLLAAAAPLTNVRTLIVDLRSNGGGRDQQAQLAASLLTTEEIEWVRYRHRMFPNVAHATEPQKSYLRPLDVPFRLNPSRLLLLIGPGTFSTSEVFVGAFSRLDSTITVGASTGGGAGNPIEFRLPLTGLTVSIPVSEYFLAGSNHDRIEGRGIDPKIRVVTSASDIRLGRDKVLETAIEASRTRGV